MNKQIRGLLLASTLALVVTGCATTDHSEAWTYKVVFADGNTYTASHVPTVEGSINSMTRQGWHLVSVSAAGSASTAPNPDKIMIVFKRHQ